MITSIVIIVSMLLLEGFFSGTETALVSCNKMRVRYKMEKGSLSARLAWALLGNMHRVLVTTLVGTNLCVVTGSVVATSLCIRLFGQNGPVVASIVMIPLILIFGEILPKAIYRVYSNTLILFCAPVLLFFQRLLFPIVVIVEGVSSIITRLFGLKGKKDPLLTREDIELLVKQIASEGVLEVSEQGAIHQIFDFCYTRVGEIMVRLRDVVTIDYNDTRDVIIKKAQEYRFTRYPVVENRQVKGVLNIFDIFYNEGDWHRFIRPIRQVYSNQRINDILYQMQRNKELMSAVVRKGKFIGIVTLEDIISEIELI